jgi:hypothetical protein
MARCLHCGGEFRPRRAGHVYCKPWCRHQGERKPYDPEPVDPEVVDRLFDPRRDPEEIVKPDDFFLPVDADPEWRVLYDGETVGARRRWYENLKALGQV